MTTDIAAILARRDELKRRDPEAILLFPVEDEKGDMYRAYGPDALDLEHAALLSVGSCVVSKPDSTRGWCGIEPSDLESVLASIVKVGKRAVVCERVLPSEAAKVQKAGKAGKAKVERIVTEGTPASWECLDDDEIRIDEKMGPNQAVDLLNHLFDGPEESHIAADRILCSVLRGIGYPDVAAAFERCKARNRFWYA